MSPISPIDNGTRPTAIDPSERLRQEPELREAAPKDLSPEAIRSAVQANRQAVFGGRSLEFAYDDDIDRVVVTIRSNETEEVVRQIPPEEYLQFVSQFREMLGVMFNEVI